MDSHEFLKSLTVVLAVAAVTTVVFQRFKQPVVLGCIIAGLIGWVHHLVRPCPVRWRGRGHVRNQPEEPLEKGLRPKGLTMGKIHTA